MTSKKEIGRVIHFYGQIKVGVIKLSTTLKVGDKIHIKGAHDDFEQKVGSMQLDHKSVTQGKKGQEVAIKVDSTVHKNDKVLSVSQ